MSVVEAKKKSALGPFQIARPFQSFVLLVQEAGVQRGINPLLQMILLHDHLYRLCTKYQHYEKYFESNFLDKISRNISIHQKLIKIFFCIFERRIDYFDTFFLFTSILIFFNSSAFRTL